MSVVDAYQCILTKLDFREFDSKPVPADIKTHVLEAARATGTGKNLQHWRFILVHGRERLNKLSDDTGTGKWIEKAGFAVIVLTDPNYRFHLIDAGRVVQDMQLAAWNSGVVSCICTNVDEGTLRKDFGYPKEMSPTAILGFGYPTRKITGRKKNRKPLSELAFIDTYGNNFDPKKLGK